MQNEKWRVLIVDDEFRIGMLIKKLIRWDELHMECMDVVDNGETAFQIVKSKRPDIIITDIRMPKINGLELIRMTRELYREMKFIVISGYKEFEYAHRALQYEVNDYLLKPINENELNKVLKKIYQELESRRQQYRERIEFQETVSESRQIIKRDFLKNIIEQEDEAEIEDYRVSLEGEIYRGIDIKLDYVDYRKSDKKQDRLTVERIVSIVEGILKTEAEEVLICEKENLHIYCLFNYDYSKAKTIRNNINDILSGIKEYLIGFEQYEVTIGVGKEKTEFSEIRFSIREANHAAGNRIKMGTGRLIYADSIGRMKEEEAVSRAKEYQDTLLSSMEIYSRENLEQCINQIYSDYMLREDLDFSYCYEVADWIVSFFFEHMDMQKEESRQLWRRLQSSCQNCYSITSLKNLLKTNLGGYLEASRIATEAESTRPIRQARQYIEEHYNEKIILEDIAEIVGLNPVYFSVLFKKEAGINFSNYLVNIRMEKAKGMLRSSNETIAAIAEQVGYKDSRYFSQTFTKTVGVKPALYRKLHS